MNEWDAARAVPVGGRPLNREHDCPSCRVWYVNTGTGYRCPVCGLYREEHAMIDLVESIGGAEVYRREWRKAHGLPL